MEHLLLEEYAQDILPASLENLLKYFEQESIPLEATDIVAVFIYIFMLETGFVTLDYVGAEGDNTCDYHYKRILSLTREMPHEWKRNGVYRFTFILLPLPRCICVVTCFPMGEDLVVNCTVKDFVEGEFCLLIDPLQYVITKLRYQNLRDLSLKFKNTISVPLKNLILEENSLRSVSLKGLPPELIFKVLRFCDKEGIRNLQDTCKFFKHFQDHLDEIRGEHGGSQFCNMLPERTPRLLFS